MIEFIVGAVVGAMVVYFICRNKKVQEKLGVGGGIFEDERENDNVQVK